MRIEDEFRDLAPLRPKLDADRFARMMAGIEQAAAPELARRAALPAPNLTMLLADWTRPAMSAAALVALLAAGLIRAGAAPQPQETAGLDSALGYPDAVSAWVEGGWTPSVEELLVAMETR